MIATAILPVKRLGAAKRRLGTGLDDLQRRDLVLAMAGDVLEAIGGARTVEPTISIVASRRSATPAV